MSFIAFIEHLDAHGYAVLPRFIDSATTARIRAHIDSLLTPPEPADLPARPRVHVVRHPIQGPIMAELLQLPGELELACAMLRAQSICDLRILEQVLIRTDPGPGPYGPGGWHVDMAFLPSHYDSSPRGTYYHMVHCCNTVKPGGGAFTIVPGSHRLTYAATAKGALQDLPAFKANPIEIAGIDVSKPIEVCAEEGDLLVFNPMCLHSASANSTTQPRYVYFSSFMDKSASYLINDLKANNYLKPVPEDLRNNLPTPLHSLFGA